MEERHRVEKEKKSSIMKEQSNYVGKLKFFNLCIKLIVIEFSIFFYIEIYFLKILI